MKFRNKGVKIEKTKSRNEIFSSVFQSDPSLLAFQASIFADRLSCIHTDKQKVNEF
ncbi:Lmo0850 family protein [Actinomycetes bacterium NPDC127524]|uniref:Lmo0850 family protein n=1 Tax=Bacillus sp. OV322 TaxID=1882764 RepID=UPI003529D05F